MPREARFDRAADTARSDAVLLIIGNLFFAAILGYGQKSLNAFGHDVRVENDFAIEMASGTAAVWMRLVSLRR